MHFTFQSQDNLQSIETVQYVGQKLWQMLPPNIRESQLLMEFKEELGSCTMKCDCRLCNTFVSVIGFF